MPNYITNHISMEGSDSDIEAVINFLRNDEEDVAVDFNNVIPMPESLNMTSGSIEDQAIAVYMYRVRKNDNKIVRIFNYPWVEKAGISTLDELCEKFENDNPDIVALGEKYVNNIEQHGHSTWYGWCCDNWGTKWNALDAWSSGNTIGFETAWSGVPDIMEKISEKFPNIKFTYRWADEDFGCNLGELVLKGGKIIDTNIPSPCSDEAYEMAADILGYDPRDEWDEEEEEEE